MARRHSRPGVCPGYTLANCRDTTYSGGRPSRAGLGGRHGHRPAGTPHGKLDFVRVSQDGALFHRKVHSMGRQMRLTEPLIRDNGTLRPASWDEALDRAAAGFAAARERDATKSFGMFSCSKATNEMNYAAQKFTRAVMGSNNIDSCNRT